MFSVWNKQENPSDKTEQNLLRHWKVRNLRVRCIGGRDEVGEGGSKELKS